MSNTSSAHYDASYAHWQSSIGEFGGWANQIKFSQYISKDAVVLDFGCGGGYLLKNLSCAKKLGVEINPLAATTAKENGIEVYLTTESIPNETIDAIISNHALEHVLRPLDELKELHKKLKNHGKIIFVVPCEAISYKYKPKDVNHHLYTWSPMCLGNLMTEAGFTVIESKAYISKWPPLYRTIARFSGRIGFHLICRIYGHLGRSLFQVRVIAQKNT